MKNKNTLLREVDEYVNSIYELARNQNGMYTQVQVRQAYINGKKSMLEEITELKNNNKVYCEGNGETLVVNVSFDSFTRINANHKMYYPHNNELEKENAELKNQIEKMKNWCNCKNYQHCLIELAEQGKGLKPSESCRNCKKWEIKENDKI